MCIKQKKGFHCRKFGGFCRGFVAWGYYLFIYLKILTDFLHHFQFGFISWKWKFKPKNVSPKLGHEGKQQTHWLIKEAIRSYQFSNHCPIIRHSSLKQPHTTAHTHTAHSLRLMQVFLIILLLQKPKLKQISKWIWQISLSLSSTVRTSWQHLWNKLLKSCTFQEEKSLLRVLTSVRAATNWRYFFIKVVWSTTVGPCAETNAILEDERSAFST